MSWRFNESTENVDDFVVRQRPYATKLILVFFISFSALYITGNPDSQANHTLFVMTLLLVIGSLSWFTISYTQRKHDMLLLTEFQNALFASAASLSARFCLIVKRDGSIVYVDPGFQKIFQHPQRGEFSTLDELLAENYFTAEQRDQITVALSNGSQGGTVFNLSLPGGNTVRTAISIDPLPRPKGYFLVRGREYVDQRNGADIPIPNNIADSNMPALVSMLLNNLPMGIYFAEKDGTITFSNDQFESMLGYERGSFEESQPRLQTLLLDESSPLKTPEPPAFQGEVRLVRKDGSNFQVSVNQQVVNDSGGRAVGIFGIIHPDIALGDVKKKFSW